MCLKKSGRCNHSSPSFWSKLIGEDGIAMNISSEVANKDETNPGILLHLRKLLPLNAVVTITDIINFGDEMYGEFVSLIIHFAHQLGLRSFLCFVSVLALLLLFFKDVYFPLSGIPVAVYVGFRPMQSFRNSTAPQIVCGEPITLNLQ